MKLLFLDFDGVLNSWAFWTQPEYLALADEDRVNTVDRRAVERVNRIVEATGCQVVISSTWRFLKPTETREKIEAFLIANGYRGRVFGTTPRDIRCDWHGDEDCSHAHRGGEINQWMVENPFIKITQFVILDDGGDMLPYKDHLVQTTMADGLLDEHVERAIAILGGQ